MSCEVAIILDDHHVTPDQLAEQHCDKLRELRGKAIEKALALMDCLGGPKEIGDEVYDYSGEIEKLFEFVKHCELLCNLTKRKAFHAISLPGNTCPSSCFPSSDELWSRYQGCCGK